MNPPLFDDKYQWLSAFGVKLLLHRFSCSIYLVHNISIFKKVGLNKFFNNMKDMQFFYFQLCNVTMLKI